MTVEATRRLAAARLSRRPCAPVRDLLPAGDLDAAYAVQSEWVADRVAAGATIVGRKIGLTNPAVQAQLGVDAPDFGFLLDDMACQQGVPIDITRLLQPRIEAEMAFVLARDLDAALIGPADVAAATAHVIAALEIVDSRIAGWDIGIVDTVADNASSGLFVLGTELRELGDLDLAGCAMTMWRCANGDNAGDNGDNAGDNVVSTGSGAGCLGNPLAAVAWLATTARDLGRPLRAGEVVLSGALGPVVPVAPGDQFWATISEIGDVAATFTASPS